VRREALFSLTGLLAPRVAWPEPDGRGSLTVAGYFGAATGLGAATRRLFHGLQEARFTPVAADLTGPLRQGPVGPAPEVQPGPGTLIVHVNGPMLPWALFALGRRAVLGKRMIAVWNWELPELPEDWTRGLRACHRIWVASRFVAKACSRPGGPPISVVPYPVPAPRASALGRSDFGLAEGSFVTLAIFDAGSSLARKNPLGAIAAHRAAFGDSPDHVLVLKTHNVASAGSAWGEVTAAAAGMPNIRIVDFVMPRADLTALMRAADTLISLHRAEGFGFAIAEAMAIGKPVVATAWSGNMDFMVGPGAFPVPYRLVPAHDPQATYDFPTMKWAEPSIDAAAEQLRRLAADPVLRAPAPVDFPAPDYAALLL
jgi:glycosyltransferase involved in cell wall biosynthesis